MVALFHILDCWRVEYEKGVASGPYKPLNLHFAVIEVTQERGCQQVCFK